MRRTEAHQGVRMIKFSSILARYEAAEFSQLEAAELLGVGERTFRRWRERFEDEGEAGLLDRRLGKASSKRVPQDRSDEVERCIARATRLHGQAFPRASGEGSPVRLGLYVDEEVSALKGLAGEGQASRGASAQAGAPAVARHDAASGRLDACVACGPVGAGSGRHDGRCDERHSVGVSGARRGHCLDVPGLAEVFGQHGLPLSFYTDRAAIIFTRRKRAEGRPHAPDASGPGAGASGRRTYRGLFAAGAGRSERVFHTLQDRLVKEFALAGIATMEAADLFLRDVYIPAHNARLR